MRPTLPFLPVATLGFVLFGALLVLVGASLDELRAALDLDLTRSGVLGAGAVLGIGLGVLAGGPLVDRFARRPLFCAATVLSGAALCGVSPGQEFGTVLLYVFAAGVGGGLYETILNAAAVERYRERSVRVVALMHAGATVGAMLTPVAIDLLLAADGNTSWTRPFHTVGAAHLALALVTPALQLGAPTRGARTDAAAPAPPRVLTPPLAWLCAAAFAYVGVESSITVFAIPYADGALGLAPGRGRGAISLFWLGLLAGRLVFALRKDADDARLAAVAGALAAVAIAAGVSLAWSRIEVLLALTGFALGGVFPLLVALAGRRTPHATGTSVALVAGVGSAGGFAAPWLTGVLGDAAGIGVAVGALALWCGFLSLAGLLAERAWRRVRR